MKNPAKSIRGVIIIGKNPKAALVSENPVLTANPTLFPPKLKTTATTSACKTIKPLIIL